MHHARNAAALQRSKVLERDDFVACRDSEDFLKLKMRRISFASVH
jgi:hypothetical protein